MNEALAAVAAGPAKPGQGAPVHGGLLCVANFAANTGYAWTFIESMYAAVAGALAERRVRTWVAYPRLEGAPAPLADSPAVPVVLEVQPGSWRSARATADFIRRHGVTTLYLADRPVWHPSYALFRAAGVRWIVVHDHTSGERSVPGFAKRELKRARQLWRGAAADRVVAVSEFVARRKREVDCVPSERVTRIWNSHPPVAAVPAAGARLRREFELDAGVIVGCASRATPEKGVAHLLRAFDRCCAARASAASLPTLVYFGDGPAFDELRQVRDGLSFRERIVLAGYRADAAELLAGSDICAVPSVWHEAFGLAALEPMARGIPVIASRVGGIPEIVVDGETGILTAPGDELALAAALGRLIDDPAERARLGRNGAHRARSHFSREAAVSSVLEVLAPGLEPPA